MDQKHILRSSMQKWSLHRTRSNNSRQAIKRTVSTQKKRFFSMWIKIFNQKQALKSKIVLLWANYKEFLAYKMRLTFKRGEFAIEMLILLDWLLICNKLKILRSLECQFYIDHYRVKVVDANCPEEICNLGVIKQTFIVWRVLSLGRRKFREQNQSLVQSLSSLWKQKYKERLASFSPLLSCHSISKK